MNTEKIELASVSKLIDVLSRLDYINPEIPTNDKSPSWDGFVNLYKVKDSCSKKDLERRIPIQVKGHYSKAPYQDLISFSADTSDLKNYLNECGVLFFVIYVDEDSNFQIYYSKLTRLILRRLLKGKENQESISIHLEKFPTEKKIATDIFFNFSVDMELSLPKSDISIKDVIEGKMIGSGFNSFSMTYKGIQFKDDPWGAFLNNKSTLCLKNDITGIMIPLETEYSLIINSKEKEDILINGIKYYDGFERIRMAGNKLILKFGKSFSLNLDVSNEKISGKFNFKINGNLTDRIKDTKFIINLLDKKSLTIGNHTIKFPIREDEINNSDIEYFKNNLILLEKTQGLLSKLNVSQELEYDLLTENDEKILIQLINTVLLGSKYFRNKDEKSYLYKITIGNIKLLLVADVIDDKSCYLYDFFDERNKAQCSFSFADESERFLIPNSFILRKEDFKEIDNLNYIKIINDIKKSQGEPKLREYTYYYIQEMINGYREREKNKDLLQCCLNECLAFLKDIQSGYDYNTLKY